MEAEVFADFMSRGVRYLVMLWKNDRDAAHTILLRAEQSLAASRAEIDRQIALKPER